MEGSCGVRRKKKREHTDCAHGTHFGGDFFLNNSLRENILSDFVSRHECWVLLYSAQVLVGSWGIVQNADVDIRHLSAPATSNASVQIFF